MMLKLLRNLNVMLLLGISSTAIGQQMPQFSQYLRNQYMVNPGAAGMYDFVDVTIGGRMQWANFENAPMSSYLYASAPLSKNTRTKFNPSLRTSGGPMRNPEIRTGKLKHALGGMIIADQYGAFRQLKGALTYALHLPVSRDFNLSFGVNVGMSNHAFIKERAQTLNMLDPTLGYTDDTYDTYAQASNLNTMNVGAGLYFYSKNLFVGVGAEQLTRDLVSFGTGFANFQPTTHVNFTAGYKFPLSENVTLTPAVLVKYMHPAPVTLEGSLQLEYKEWLWFGLSYRQGIGGYSNPDALVGMAGLNISRRFKFGYSFDFSLSEFNQYSAGGHELVLGLMLGR